jgi:hypothetical protein
LWSGETIVDADVWQCCFVNAVGRAVRSRRGFHELDQETTAKKQGKEEQP